jgi:hypothetical protein
MRKSYCIFVSTLRLVLAEDLWLPGALPQYANQELRNRWEGKATFSHREGYFPSLDTGSDKIQV